MTSEELNDFRKLSPEQQEDYKYQANKHPNWDHKKLMVRAGFTEKVDSIIETQGDVDVDDKDVMQEILEGVGKWLERTVPKIWEGVKNLFANILEGIINGVINFFGGILDAIF